MATLGPDGHSISVWVGEEIRCSKCGVHAKGTAGQFVILHCHSVEDTCPVFQEVKAFYAVIEGGGIDDKKET